MVVRRTGTQPAPQPLAPRKPASPPKPANVPQSRPSSDFQAARTRPLSLQGDVQRPFVPPTAGEWTADQATGQRSDPVTIYVHGSLDQVETSLGATGWTQADPKSLSANLRYVGAAAKQEISKALAKVAQGIDGLEVGIGGAFGVHLHPWLETQPRYVPGVDRMPVSNQTYRGQVEVAAFEKNNDPLGGRDHLRIFATGEKDAQGRDVYAIAASRDSGIVFAPNHPECAFLFHAVTPDVDGERDNVLQSLQQANPGAQTQSFTLPFGKASKIGEYVGDGKAVDVVL